MPLRWNPPVEYKAFIELEHWQPIHKIPPLQTLLDSNNPFYPCFSALYFKTQELYRKVPRRKDGENPLIHPLNVVCNLRKAGVTDGITLGAGLLHDYIEEEVDIYKREQKIPRTAAGREILDKYEEKVFTHFGREVMDLCQRTKTPSWNCSQVIEILRLLTKHKRHFYFKYISAIFTNSDSVLKEKAIQVKLADRMHNILCVDCFSGEDRIYQCFKNLFILNNTKKYLLDSRRKKINVHPATLKLFKKCSKATYDAFLVICRQASQKEIMVVQSMIELAFHKFAIEKDGLDEVTDVNHKEIHPMRLFHAVVRKYGARLTHEHDTFELMKKQEMVYCQKFFADYKFTPEQLQALIDYKDAYSLKEVVAKLLYNSEYVISGFLAQELSREGRIKR